jgi:ribosomal protein L11 methyltransferase
MWWRLSLPLPPVLEESLLWKLESLGLHRLAVQHAPESPDQRTVAGMASSVGVAAGST